MRRIPAAFLVVSTSLFAQPPAGGIRGHVIDPSGAAVAGALVRVYLRSSGLQQSTAAASDGAFRFEPLPAGDYLVEARTGPLSLPKPVETHVEAGCTALVELRLELQTVSTRVLVTASSTPLSTEESGKAMDVVDASELDQRAEITVSESLRTVPGLRVQQLGGPGSFTRILTRGMRAFDTAFAIDGMRFRDVTAVQGDATAFIGDLLVIDADRLEVLRGSGSSLYGTNAIGGVVNIVTDQGGGPLRGEVSLEGGGLGVERALAKAAGGWREGRFQYSAGLTRFNVNGGVDGIESARNTGGQAFGQWRPSAATALSVRVLAHTSTVGITSNPVAAPISNLPSGSGPVPAVALAPPLVRLLEQGQTVNWGAATFAPNLYDPDNRRIADFTSLLVAWNQQWNPRASYRIAWQGFASERDNRDGPLGQGYQPEFPSSNFFGGRFDTLQARTDLMLRRGNLLSAGYEWEREHYDNHATDQNPSAAFRVDARARIAERSHAVFAQDQVRFFSDRLLISLSGRVQHFQLSQPTFEGGAPQYASFKLPSPPNAYTGDASMSYFLPSSATKLRAHFGNGYRAPTLYERFGTSFFFGEFSPYGDPRLHPERSVAGDAGIDQYFANSRVRLSGSLFYTRLEEIIGFASLINDPFGRWGGYVNTGGGLARGVEVSGEARPTPSSNVRASYTYTNADERNSILTDGSVRSIRVFPHMVTAYASQQLTRRWQVSADFLAASQFVSGTFFVGSGTRPYLFAGPRKLDATLNYSVPVSERLSLRFYARVENFLNQRYYEDGFRTPRRWATGGLKLYF
jgi:vitamin B12 transporter